MAVHLDYGTSRESGGGAQVSAMPKYTAGAPHVRFVSKADIEPIHAMSAILPRPDMRTGLCAIPTESQPTKFGY